MGRALYDSASAENGKSVNELLSEKNKLETWLKVESALARAQAEEGFIPEDAARIISEKAKYENLDLEEMSRIKEKVGHGFVPFVKVLTRACGEEGGKYVHYGVTTQNIQQTSQMYITMQIHKIFMSSAAEILHNLSVLAEENKNTVMAGRTHGRHAIPITYGYKVSVWISELLNACERMEECEKRVFQVMMGGAVGAFNATGETGRRVQKRVAEKLGMHEMPVPSRNIFSTKEEYMMNLALLCNALHKMAEEVYYTGLEEFGEISEPFAEGTIGSSTMPQKINPKLAKGIIANSSKLYSLISAGLSSGCRMFEGDSSEYMLFDGMLEEALELTAEVLKRAVKLTAGIRVNKERMYRNACLNKGLDNSENIMMHIAARIGKDRAHALVYEKAMLVELEGREFIDVLKEDETIMGSVSEEELEQWVKPENYSGLSSTIAEDMAAKAEQVSQDLQKKYGR